jgi:hypothetical protein
MIGVDVQKDYSTGAAAISYTFAPGKKISFEELRLNLSAASATAENFVITLKSHKGTAYDVVLYSRDMNTVQDLVYIPERVHQLEDGDSLLFEWTNTNTRTYGMEIVYKAAL